MAPDLMVMLDRLLSGKQAELALGASIVERDVQSAEGAHGLFDERDDVILSGDISSHEQGASTGRSNLPRELVSPSDAAAGDETVSLPSVRELARTSADGDNNRVLNFVIGRGSGESRLFFVRSKRNPAPCYRRESAESGMHKLRFMKYL